MPNITMSTMSAIVETPSGSFYPTAPSTPAEAGLSEEHITELVLKALHGTSGVTGAELARRVGLSFNVLEPSLEYLKTNSHCEIMGGSSIGGSTFRYRLTDLGHTRAVSALGRNQYAGLAPVPIKQYLQYMDEFHRAAPRQITPTDVRKAFSHLVVSDRVLNEIGTAVNADQSIFLYGPAGNGKTVMAQAIGQLLVGTIAIPHALEVDGNIIRFFDPTVHQALPPQEDRLDLIRYDRRWIHCRRPMVAVGGELTLESLSLAYNPRTGVYRAPVQALANGGVFLLDEFGRQRCEPRELLNWWMLPLESHVEYLTLQSGEKLEMPFHALVIFSTNLRPSELVDEAFLRRIHYKVYAENPTPEDYIRIFERCCRDRDIPFDEQLPRRLLDGFYRQRRIELRACQPRDLIEQALSLARYQGKPAALTAELLEIACTGYFLDDRETPRHRA